jgi:hypothetical protein
MGNNISNDGNDILAMLSQRKNKENMLRQQQVQQQAEQQAASFMERVAVGDVTPEEIMAAPDDQIDPMTKDMFLRMLEGNGGTGPDVMSPEQEALVRQQQQQQMPNNIR